MSFAQLLGGGLSRAQKKSAALRVGARHPVAASVGKGISPGSRGTRGGEEEEEEEEEVEVEVVGVGEEEAKEEEEESLLLVTVGLRSIIGIFEAAVEEDVMGDADDDCAVVEFFCDVVDAE